MRNAPRFGALALTACLVLAACGGDDDDDAGAEANADTPTTIADMPDASGDAMDDMTDTAEVSLTASDLRATLEFVLEEHVYLAGLATGEALGGRTDGFEAAAAALEQNSNDITAAVTAVYGEDAGDAFDPLWKKHIGFFVDYTTGIATGDQAKADQAIADLTAYADEFGAFLESATEGGLPKDAVAELLGVHANTLIAAIDAQHAGDAARAYSLLKEAAGHMPMIADALADAIAAQMNLA